MSAILAALVTAAAAAGLARDEAHDRTRLTLSKGGRRFDLYVQEREESLSLSSTLCSLSDGDVPALMPSIRAYNAHCSYRWLHFYAATARYPNRLALQQRFSEENIAAQLQEYCAELLRLQQALSQSNVLALASAVELATAK